MGYIIECGHRITSHGLHQTRTIQEVIESPGQYEWVTLAKHGKPLLGSDNKPFRIAHPDHSPWIVYATWKDAHAQL